MEFKLGFGKGTADFEIEDKNLMGVLEPNKIEISLTGEAEVKRALRAPIGLPLLGEVVRQGDKIAIITSDITRPMPSKVALPPLLEELYAAGIAREDIIIVFALGSHRKHTEEEMKYLVGEAVFQEIKCIDLDVTDCVYLGETSTGTPVSIFRPVVEADRRICLGNIEYHYFAGYSGGAKAIMPGVSTREAIQKNHSMMVKEEAKAGAITTNPLRQDIDEVARLIDIDYILNVVLDEKKNIIKAVAGHYLEAHRAGCAFLDTLYKVEIKEPADIVMVSPGGYPKDINLYQAQKALDNAKHAVKEGGVVILLASCKEGLGEGTFERWMTQSPSPEDMIRHIQEHFELGGHKAAAIAMVLQKAKVFLVSDLPEDFVRSIFLEPYKDAPAALEAAMQYAGEAAKVLVMPYGGSTLPVVSSK